MLSDLRFPILIAVDGCSALMLSTIIAYIQYFSSPPQKKTHKSTEFSQKSRTYIYQLPQIESNLFKNSFFNRSFLNMFRLVFLSWLQFVQCLCILFFYITVLFACMICFYYNVCDCHAIIKGNLLIVMSVCLSVCIV